MTKDTDRMEQRRWYMCERCRGVQVQANSQEHCSLCGAPMVFVAKTFHAKSVSVSVDAKNIFRATPVKKGESEP